MDICVMCGAPAECTHHLIFGMGLRKLADRDNLTVPLCNRCHNLAVKPEERIHDNPRAEDFSKMYGQAIWMLGKVTTESEREDLKRQFRERYGINYI